MGKSIKLATEGRSNFDYYLDEETKTVVAVLNDCRMDFWNYLLKSFDLELSNAMSDNIADIYKGKSRCHPTDEFDLEEGKRIARNRALKRYYRARYNELNKYGEYLDNELTKVDTLTFFNLTKEIRYSEE